MTILIDRLLIAIFIMVICPLLFSWHLYLKAKRMEANEIPEWQEYLNFAKYILLFPLLFITGLISFLFGNGFF